MRSALALIVSLLPHLSVAAGPECNMTGRASLTSLDDPKKITQFINQAGFVKSPADLACCLTQVDKNLKIVIMNDSIAGQNGTPANPRVLIVRTTPDGKSLDSVFSINSNSGSKHQTNGNSLEMMKFGKNNSQNELFDFNFSERPMKHEANPQSCLSCHGTNSGELQKVGGPRPLFAPFPWPRVTSDAFEKDTNASGQNPFCKQISKKLPQIREASRKALEDKPAYKCVKDLPQMDVRNFDAMLSQNNRTRIAKLVKSSKDYDKFKFSMMASKFCRDFTPEQYIPKNILDTMTNTEALAPELQTSKVLSKSELVDFSKKQSPEELAAVREDSLLGANIDYDKTVTSNDRSRCDPSNPLSPKDLRGNSSIYQKYVADSVRHRTTPQFGAMRFLLESRGIDISNWNMLPSSKYGRTDSDLFDCSQSPGAADPSSGQAPTPTCRPPLLEGDPELAALAESKDCEAIKKKSLAAFGATSRNDDETSGTAIH